MLFQKFATLTHFGCHDLWIDMHLSTIWIYDFVGLDKNKSNHALINLTHFLCWLNTKKPSKVFYFNCFNNRRCIALHVLYKLFNNQPKT